MNYKISAELDLNAAILRMIITMHYSADQQWLILSFVSFIEFVILATMSVLILSSVTNAEIQITKLLIIKHL